MVPAARRSLARFIGGLPRAVLLALCVACCAACRPLLAPPASSSSLTLPSPTGGTATPIPTEPSTPTVASTPSATQAPALDREAVSAEIEAVHGPLEVRAVEPLCMRWADADGDEEPEWVGLYLQPSEPPQLKGFVLDGDAWHDITAPAGDEEGLGSYPSCELEVRDVNVDGRAEVLVQGRTSEGVDLMHIFVWGDAGYDMLASFRGDAGIEMRDINGDLVEEIVARYDAGDGLVWEQIHTWDGAHYGWTWERYSWLYADHPHVALADTPEHAVISFYLALSARDLPGAYHLFSAASQASRPYETWAGGFDTMLAVEAGSVSEIERGADRATVTAQVRAYDNLDGYVIARLWDVTWSLVNEGGLWRLEQGSSHELDRWEAPYYH